MRIPSLALAALCFITFSGSCRVKAAQAAAKPDPRFEGIPLEHHAYLDELEKKQPRLMASWFKLRALYEELDYCSTVFGMRERRRARSSIPSLKNKIESEKNRFYRGYYRLLDPIMDKNSTLTARAAELFERGAAQNDPAVTEQSKRLYDQALVLSERIKAIRTLDDVIPRSTRVKSNLTLIGISSGNAVVQEVIEKHPRLLEARLDIKDCQADLERLNELKAELANDTEKQWSSSQEAQVHEASRQLEKATSMLLKEAERAKRPLFKDAETLKQKIASAQEKVNAYKKRRRNARARVQSLNALQDDLDHNLEVVATIDQLASWK